MNSLRRDSLDIRASLPYSYTSFFARYGSFTPAQMQAIPLVLAGNNVVLSAPTAMGKTEAIVAPVAEQHVSNVWSGLSVLYVVPTRALANDLFERIEGPLRELNVICRIKHGERQERFRTTPNWLITTPESLDSILGRQTEMLRTVHSVIIDEVHLLDNTYRGDQLRVLLRRLGQITVEQACSTHLLSATLPDPVEMSERYVTDYTLVPVDGQREIAVHYVQTHEDIKDLALRNRWKKILYFCNTRRNVEHTAHLLEELWKPYPVVSHHGSLERGLREEAESVMKQNRVAVCVATMTLEIGIDIGDIDLIVLSEPPWSVAALLQRVGRGSRRKAVIQAAALYNTEDERSLLETMFEMAETGSYAAEPYAPDLSVIVQQALSYVFQNRSGVSRRDVVGLLRDLGPDVEIDAILSHLIAEGWLQEYSSHLHPTTRLMDLSEKGEIHSNVPDQEVMSVVDTATGKTIGRVSGLLDQVFLLGGTAWRIVNTRGNSVYVVRHHGGSSTGFTQRHNRGRFHSLLPPMLRSG